MTTIIATDVQTLDDLLSAERLRAIGRGSLGLVERLLAYCRETKRTLEWQPGTLSSLSPSGEREHAATTLRNGVFRAALARLGVLCEEYQAGSATAYAGEGVIRLPGSPPAFFHVRFSNIPDHQFLELKPLMNDPNEETELAPQTDSAEAAEVDENLPPHEDPDADRDLDADPPEHELPPETDLAATFRDMNLMRPLQDALDQAGYYHPTPVQEAVIPVALTGKDVIGQAQTGTGKTAAFLLPLMNRWRPHKLKGPIGLVMTPTRELALQVATEAEMLAPSTRFRTVAVYGGAGMGKQLDGLSRGCDLVVGTPGRMLDHLSRGSMRLNDIRYVVLDEADRMLDIGFRPDIERILKKCPLTRQTLLMSATVPDSIKKLVNRYMTNPVHLQMTPEVLTVDKIRQSYFTVEAEKKFELLVKVIEREQPRQCLIFVERKRWADNLYRDIKRKVGGAAVIHGDLPQSMRERIMAAFRTGDIKYLIATDVMSRGIDVDDLSHVINYDLPQDIESYVHRIGRTGRIGKDGIAISFVLPEQGGLLTDIEMMINKLITADEIPGEWYKARPAVRRIETVLPEKTTAEKVAEVRDDSGWGIDDAGDETGKVGSTVEEQQADAPAEKKPAYGKPKKRYSDRL